MNNKSIPDGAPGIEPRWTPSAKDGIGTAYRSAPCIWFTLSHGIVKSIYFPHVDTSNTRSRVKRPGDELTGDPTELKLVDHPHAGEMVAYERLLGDAMAGDGALFAGQAGVEAAWRIVEPILDLATPVHEYEPGTWGPPEAEKLSADICGCDSPVWLLPNGGNRT